MRTLKWTIAGLCFVASVGTGANGQGMGDAQLSLLRASQSAVALKTVSAPVMNRLIMPAPAGIQRRTVDSANRSADAVQDRTEWISHQSGTCDASKFKAAAVKRSTGSALALGGLVIALAGGYKLARYSGEGSYVPPAVVAGSGLLVGFIGQSMMSSTVSPQDFDNAVQAVKVGDTKFSDVTNCMGAPKSKTSSGDVQTALYTSKDYKTLRTVVFTAKAGVISDVRIVESQR